MNLLVNEAEESKGLLASHSVFYEKSSNSGLRMFCVHQSFDC